VNKKKSV